MKRALFLTGLLASGLGLSACGGGGGDGGGAASVPPPAPTPGLVSNVGAVLSRLTPVQAQESLPAPASAAALNYLVGVSNTGTGEAKNVSVKLVQGSAVTNWVDCKATGGAVCPAPGSGDLDVVSMPAGSTLSLIASTASDLASTSPISAALTVNAPDDVTADNNQATVSTARDARNGTYTLFGYEGKSVELDLNVDSGAWVTKSAGVTTASGYVRGVGENFDANKAGTSASTSLTSGFRVAGGFIVGNLPIDGLSATPIGFAGAKTLVSSLADVAGEFNFFSRTKTPSTGATVSSITTGQLVSNPNRLLICSDVSIYSPSICPAASLRTYNLTLSGTTFSAVNANDPAETFQFGLVKSGGGLVYFRNGTLANGDLRFTVGMTADTRFAAKTIALASASDGTLREGLISPSSVNSTAKTEAVNRYESSLAVSSATTAPPSLRSSTMTGNTTAPFAGQSMFVIQGPLFASVGVRGGGLNGRIEVGLLE